jgi:putative transcriptional regulator
MVNAPWAGCGQAGAVSAARHDDFGERVGNWLIIANSIRRLRFANGEMTQADLADRVGVTRQTIIAAEQGKYSPALEMAFQIARDFRDHGQPRTLLPRP